MEHGGGDSHPWAYEAPHSCLGDPEATPTFLLAEPTIVDLAAVLKVQLLSEQIQRLEEKLEAGVEQDSEDQSWPCPRRTGSPQEQGGPCKSLPQAGFPQTL